MWFSLYINWLHISVLPQIHELEHIHHACAERERHLQRLHSWTEQQKNRMNQWKQSTGQTLARYAVVELEVWGWMYAFCEGLSAEPPSLIWGGHLSSRLILAESRRFLQLCRNWKRYKYIMRRKKSSCVMGSSVIKQRVWEGLVMIFINR